MHRILLVCLMVIRTQPWTSPFCVWHSAYVTSCTSLACVAEYITPWANIFLLFFVKERATWLSSDELYFKEKQVLFFLHKIKMIILQCPQIKNICAFPPFADPFQPKNHLITLYFRRISSWRTILRAQSTDCRSYTGCNQGSRPFTQTLSSSRDRVSSLQLIRTNTKDVYFVLFSRQTASPCACHRVFGKKLTVNWLPSFTIRTISWLGHAARDLHVAPVHVHSVREGSRGSHVYPQDELPRRRSAA